MEDIITIKDTSMNDLDFILNVYENARIFMRNTNNPNQWKNNWPSKEIIINDIKNKISKFLIVNNEIACVFALINDIDPQYSNIEGNWINNDKYIVIHRIASTFKFHNVLNKVINFCKCKFKCDVRMDTHKDNLVMQKALTKNGFKYCGIIYLANKEPRLAYQLINK